MWDGNGRFSYGPNVHGVKMCLVARMAYMGTRHSLQGGVSIILTSILYNKGKFSVALGQELEEETMWNILMWFATFIHYDRNFNQAR